MSQKSTQELQNMIKALQTEVTNLRRHVDELKASAKAVQKEVAKDIKLPPL